MASVSAKNAGLGIENTCEPQDEFEMAQMLCSYEYGDWDDEECDENEH